METRICNKCGEEKPLASFPKRYGKWAHLREKTCGYCKRLAWVDHDPERAHAQRVRLGIMRMARAKGITVEQYADKRKAIKLEKELRFRIRKNIRTICPLLSAYPKIEYKINREYYLNKSKQWSKNNPAKALAKKQRRRMRLAGVRSDLTLSQWTLIKKAFGNKCAYCGTKGKMTMDHITPISKGGEHTVTNVVPACQRCNSSKHAGPPPTSVQPMLCV